MNRLADVELQLVMQGLAAQEILKLARCSRYLLHAADAPFAWKHARLCLDVNHKVSPPAVSLPWRLLGWCQLMLLPKIRARNSAGFLRHAKVVVSWRGLGKDEEEEDYYRAFLQMASRVPSIYELHTSVVFSPTRTKLVLELPSMQQLRVLWLYDETDIDSYLGVEHAIAQLPHLHTLHLVAPRAYYGSDYGYGYEPDLGFLSQIPSLTSLHLQDNYNLSLTPWWLTHVAGCSKLVELSIACPWMNGPACTKFFAHTTTQQLRSLKLYSFRATEQDFIIAFTGMRHLHSLEITNCGWIDLVLPALAHAPVLRQLTIEPNLDNNIWHPYTGINSAPSNLVLTTLLDAAPRLRCVIILRFSAVPRGNNFDLGRWLQTRFDADAVLAASDRFTIQSEVESKQ